MSTFLAEDAHILAGFLQVLWDEAPKDSNGGPLEKDLCFVQRVGPFGVYRARGKVWIRQGSQWCDVSDFFR